MKKTITWFMALVLCLSLCACGSKLTSGDLVGVWSGSWEYNGNQINMSIEFERDGTFTEVVFKNNTISSCEEGTYTIDGNKVACKTDMPGTTYFQYSGGKLKNGENFLSKE